MRVPRRHRAGAGHPEAADGGEIDRLGRDRWSACPSSALPVRQVHGARARFEMGDAEELVADRQERGEIGIDRDVRRAVGALHRLAVLVDQRREDRRRRSCRRCGRGRGSRSDGFCRRSSTLSDASTARFCASVAAKGTGVKFISAAKALEPTSTSAVVAEQRPRPFGMHCDLSVKTLVRPGRTDLAAYLDDGQRERQERPRVRRRVFQPWLETLTTPMRQLRFIHRSDVRRC